MKHLHDMLDADEANRIMPGLSDASDLPADTGLSPAGPAPASVAAPPTDAPPKDILEGDVPSSLLDFIRGYIDHESVGDPVPALVHIWRNRTTGTEEPGWFHDIFSGTQRVDTPQPGDLVRFQYQGTYPRYIHGVVMDVRGEVATVAAAEPYSATDETVLTLQPLHFKAMRGWQLNSSWPVEAFVRL